MYCEEDDFSDGDADDQPTSPATSCEEEELSDEEEEEEEDECHEREELAPPPPPVERELATSDVILPLELARLEGVEAVRVENGADLVHPRTGGETLALRIAVLGINSRRPEDRPPYTITRRLPGGALSVQSIRRMRIAGPLSDYIPD